MWMAQTFGASSGRAIARQTGATAQSRCSRRSSPGSPAIGDDRGVTASAHPEAGLEPARPARRIRPGERIHVVGAAGAGASAAALHGRWAGGSTDGCDPGVPSMYTPALDAAGIVVAPAHDPLHVVRTPPPDRLAVTKALTAVEPDHPELAAARDAGIPIEPWQQVIADAATDRELIGVA